METFGNSGIKYALYMAPLERRIYTQDRNHPPEAYKTNHHWFLGSVPACIVGESLQEWLETREDDLSAILSGYSSHGVRNIADWSIESMRRTDQFRSELSKAVRDQEIGIYWSAREWASYQSRKDLIREALWAPSLDDYIESEIDTARTRNVWLNEGEFRDFLTNVLHGHYLAYERALQSVGATSWSHAAFEHFRTSRILGYVNSKDEDWSVPSGHGRDLQRKIVGAIRSIDPVLVDQARKSIRDQSPESPLDTQTLLAALAAAAVDHRIWDAFAQIRQPYSMLRDDT
jgi:hypothetical protein